MTNAGRLPTMGSLFAGIGGFDLGFERAGFKTVWQVEIDPYCQKVLAKNFPEAERFGDIRECGSHNLKPVDVICGGFPCQPVSLAGSRLAQSDERWMWPDFARVIRELRPKFVLVENVPGLLSSGMGDVLGDLSSLGYDAEWQIVSAADIGADHIRERVWILAYPQCGRQIDQATANAPTHNEIWDVTAHQLARNSVSDSVESGRTIMVGADGTRRATKHGVCLLVDEVPGQVDRLRGLGNAVVPQIPEMIARRIKQALEATDD
jgi:DNA (cytosine-5)-methyltransferase 1